MSKSNTAGPFNGATYKSYLPRMRSGKASSYTGGITYDLTKYVERIATTVLLREIIPMQNNNQSKTINEVLTLNLLRNMRGKLTMQSTQSFLDKLNNKPENKNRQYLEPIFIYRNFTNKKGSKTIVSGKMVVLNTVNNCSSINLEDKLAHCKQATILKHRPITSVHFRGKRFDSVEALRIYLYLIFDM